MQSCEFCAAGAGCHSGKHISNAKVIGKKQRRCGRGRSKAETVRVADRHARGCDLAFRMQ
jgi:hypothetical protein